MLITSETLLDNFISDGKLCRSHKHDKLVPAYAQYCAMAHWTRKTKQSVPWRIHGLNDRYGIGVTMETFSACLTCALYAVCSSVMRIFLDRFRATCRSLLQTAAMTLHTTLPTFANNKNEIFSPENSKR